MWLIHFKSQSSRRDHHSSPLIPHIHFTEIHTRACLSFLIYGKTNKQFRARVNSVYGKKSKIKEKALSWNQRQANCNVNKTTTYDWICSKLTPVDASYSCASFCICTHSCVDLNLCAIAVSLPSAANLFLHSQQLRDKNSEPCQQSVRGFRNERCQQKVCWTRTTLTGVSKKSPQCTNSKGYFKWNFVLQS